jgi:hypothetical protein
VAVVGTTVTNQVCGCFGGGMVDCQIQLGKGSLLDLFGRVTNRDKTMLQERTMDFSFRFFCVRHDENGQKHRQMRRL